MEPQEIIQGLEHPVICTATTVPEVKSLSARPNVAMTIDVGA